MANITTQPITEVLRAMAAYDTPDAARRAANAITVAIRQMGHGYQNALADRLDVDRHTIRNWTTGRVDITATSALKVAEQIARDLPASDVTPEAIANTLFGLFYGPERGAAAKWIIDYLDAHEGCSSTHSPWNASLLVAA